MDKTVSVYAVEDFLISPGSISENKSISTVFSFFAYRHSYQRERLYANTPENKGVIIFDDKISVIFHRV